jgi:toxin YoeB
MEIHLTEEAEEDLAWQHASGNKAVLKKVRRLLEDIIKSPYEGIGKP